MDYSNLQVTCFCLLTVGATLVLAYQASHLRKSLDIPRIGPKPTLFGNTSKGEFYENSTQMVEEGYTKYKDCPYSLWTTNMDRVIIPPKYMNEFNRVPRAHLRLTATLRHAGKYTGMDIADEGSLGYDVCAGPLSQNIGRLCQPIYDEVLLTLNGKLKQVEDADGLSSMPMYSTILDLVTTSTARLFVGPDLCRDPKWLSTATGYTTDVGAVENDLQQYYRFLHPIIAPNLKSYKQLRKRFADAREILLPVFAQRKTIDGSANPDMFQWLLDSAKGPDAEGDRLIRRMLFLNMAAIHTTTHTTTNVILDLCDRPEYIEPLREEMVSAIASHGGIKASTLTSLKKLDSFMKESQRLNPMDLMIFNRQLVKPVTLSDNTTIPAKTFVSLAIYPMCRDPNNYPDPLKFDGYRFFKLRQADDGHKYQFAASDEHGPGWGFGTFACPGRFWAAAQIKLVMMALLLHFDIGYPKGQIDRPADVLLGEKRGPSRTQLLVLKRRAHSA